MSSKIEYTQNNNVKRGVGVWLFNQSGQVLMGLRLSKHGFNTWSAPGGKQEEGENPMDTAVRETLEETGIALSPRMLEYLATTDDVFPDSHYVTIHYRVKNVNMIPSVLEKNKCKEWRWFNLDRLPSNLFLPAQNLFKQKVFGV